MTVTVTPNSDVPQQPAEFVNSYLPDQLIAGPFQRVTQNGTVSSGATVNSATVLPRGTVMGQQTLGSATAVAKAGGNTGNGTVSAVTDVGGFTNVGIYQVIFTAATTFNVFDPKGRELKPGTTGVAYSDDLAFTITAGGTAFVAGDGFNITVAAGTGNFVPAVATATDGSAVPSAILVDDCNPAAAAVNAGLYLTGEFNGNALTFDTSFTVATLKTLLASRSIFIKSAVSAADPTNE